MHMETGENLYNTVDSRYSTIRYSTISVIVRFFLVPQMSVAIVRFALVTHFFHKKNVNLVRYLESLSNIVYDYIILYSDLYRNDSTICSCHQFYFIKNVSLVRYLESY